MFENKSYYKSKVSPERKFGLVMAAFFLIISLYPLLQDENIRLWSFVISFIFLVSSLLFPKTLNIPNKLWFKLGIFLGSMISPIVMGLIFFIFITPIGIIMRLIYSLNYNRKSKKLSKSYWIIRDQPEGTMRDQF